MKRTKLWLMTMVILTAAGMRAEQVLRFTGDGSRSHIKLSGTPAQLQLANASATFECWMYVESFNTDNMFYSKSSGSSYSHLFGIRKQSSTIYMAAHNGTAYSLHTLSPAIGLDSWHHLAFVCDGTTVSYYFDGVFKESQAFVYANNATHAISLGGYNPGSDMKGRISEVRVWNRARSGAEIRELRHVRLRGGDAGLLGYWPINEGSGTTILDYSGHNSTGTAVNATEWVDDAALDVKLPARLDFINSAPLVVAEYKTGSTLFTSSNEVEVIDFPVPEGYTEYQLTFGNTPAAINGAGWQAISGALTKLSAPLPVADTNLVWFAWFTNLAEEVTLRRAMADIIYTTAKPTAKAKGAFPRVVTPDRPTVIHLDDINNGSTSGKVGGTADKLTIPFRSHVMYIASGPSTNATPNEPYLSLETEGIYTIALMVENMAGHLSTATCEVTVSAYDGSAFTWTGAHDSNWHEARNWDKRLVPPAGSPVVVNSKSVSLDSSTAALASFTMNGGTLTFSGWETALEAAEVTVNGGSMTHAVNSDTAAPWESDARVYVICTNLTIAKNGSIDVTGKGYAGKKDAAGAGPGGGKQYGAASYGGVGGYYQAIAPAKVYGSAAEPVDPGSSGGGWTSTYGGNGGGAVRIEAAESVTVMGAITATGSDTANVATGSGSGGAIYITTKTIAGDGSITANGGEIKVASTSEGAAGGGGRIAVHYDPAAQSLLPRPGINFSAASGKAKVARNYGEAGTLWFPDNQFLSDIYTYSGEWSVEGFDEWTPSFLTVSNGYLRFPATSFLLAVTNDLKVVGSNQYLHKLGINGATVTCANLLLHNATFNMRRGDDAPVTFVSRGSATLSGASQWRLEATGISELATPYGASCVVSNTLDIGSGCWIYPVSHGTDGGSVRFNANTVNIAAGGGIDATAAGFVGVSEKKGLGPGFGELHRGAGYGGQGGSYSGSVGGSTYGSEEFPLLPGSSGGGWNTSAGGNGGGLIWLDGVYRLVLDGTLRANGETAANTANGGGSGGGIYINTRFFSGIGDLSVKGGNSSGGGSGGGGRIAVWRAHDKPSPPEVTVNVANGIWGGKEKGANGAPGTIFWGRLPEIGTVILLR